MGMGLIELVMKIEDEFALSILDDDAADLLTVGQTHAYVVRRLREQGPPEPGVCASARAFYRVRRGLAVAYGLPRAAVRPNSRIGDLVPLAADRGRWNDDVARRCDLRPEPFRLSRSLAPRFPDDGLTLREVVLSRVPPGALRAGAFYRPNGTVDEQAVWRKLVRIVAEQAGVKGSELGRETHYIDDLNLD